MRIRAGIRAPTPPDNLPIEDTKKRSRFTYNLEEIFDASKDWMHGEPLMHHEGITKETLRKYKTAAKRFVEFAEKSPEGFTEEAFIRWIWGLWNEGASGTTIEGYRCGVLHLQRAFRQEEFCGSPRLVRICAALKLHSRKNNPQRGGIVLSQLTELCSLNAKYSLLFKACFYGCLRITECLGILGGDLRKGDDGDTIFLRANKRLNREKTDEDLIPTRVIFFTKEFREVIEILEGTFGMGNPLFAWASEKKASDLVKKAAKDFNWPAGVIWDGAHCCRHGGAILRNARLAAMDVFHDLCGAMTRPTNQHYSRPNEARKR